MIENTMPSAQAEMLDSKVNQLVIDLSPWGGDEFLKEKLAAISRKQGDGSLASFFASPWVVNRLAMLHFYRDY